MNAYELADELWEKYLDNNECQHGYALSNGCPNDDCKEQGLYDSATMLRQQADRIAELEKEWQNTVGYHCYQAGLEEGKKTHPVKQLSDEEIWKIFNKSWENDEEITEFARAIIKEITE